jgi:heme/copper-type cytochrome/quinol oxidase subunit 1
VDDLPSFKCFTTGNWWFWFGYDIMVGVGYFHCIVLNGIVELYSYGNQFEDRGMSMTRLPLTIWAFFVTAIIGVVSSCIVICCAVIDF